MQLYWCRHKPKPIKFLLVFENKFDLNSHVSLVAERDGRKRISF